MVAIGGPQMGVAKVPFKFDDTYYNNLVNWIVKKLVYFSFA